MNEPLLFAIIAIVWFFSFFVGDPGDKAFWLMRAFLTVALILGFLEMSGVINLVELGGPPRR